MTTLRGSGLEEARKGLRITVWVPTACVIDAATDMVVVQGRPACA